MPTLLQINTSNGGMPKLPLLYALVTPAGIEGDRQKNLKYHGGPDRALCLYSLEEYAYLRTTFGIDLPPGAVGENLTTQGLDLQQLRVGDLLHIGPPSEHRPDAQPPFSAAPEGRVPPPQRGCLIQITMPRTPCKSLNQWHPQLLKIIQNHSGHLARVLTPGTLHPNDPIHLLPPAPFNVER